jgi:hypothetical protein
VAKSRLAKPNLAKPDLQAVKAFAKGGRSGLVPEGDVRLTANIRADLHRKLKHAAVDRGTTVGELLEELVDKHL